MKMPTSQVDVLKQLYAENDYPSDRLIRDTDAFKRFAAEFNSRANTEYSSEFIAEELSRVRKDKEHTGGLPHLGRRFRGPRI